MKKIKVLIISVLMTMLSAMPVLAGETSSRTTGENATEITEAIIEERVENNRARIDASVRGTWLADVAIEISNPQNGNIGVLMMTSCFQPVDEIYMGLCIDRLTEDKKYEEVDYKEFLFLPEDFDDGILAEAIVDIEVTGHEPGWYRLRGLYSVVKDDMNEFYSAETKFIEITDRLPFTNEPATPDEAEALEDEE